MFFSVFTSIQAMVQAITIPFNTVTDNVVYHFGKLFGYWLIVQCISTFWPYNSNPRELKTCVHKKPCTRLLHHNSPNQPRYPSIEEWITNYSYKGYYSQ